MAFFAQKDFFDDPALIELVTNIMAGNLTLGWYDVDAPRVRAVPADPARGLTYADCNLGGYGYDAIPELVRNRSSMAARGSVLVPDLPDIGYTVNRKSDVWAPCVPALYEEAKARRWAPAVDVPWAELKGGHDDPLRETAMAQLCTLLEEIALVAMEAPGRWVFFINQEFLELKSLLCAQMFDEARHVEACRKRALVSGRGLGRASVTAEHALKEILCAETYPEAALGSNLLLGSFVLAIYRALATLAATRADRLLATLSMQDVARSVTYGIGQAEYHLAHQPAKAEAFGAYLDRIEHTMLGIVGCAEFLEPLVLLAGGGDGADAVERGTRFARRWLAVTCEDYFARCRRAGLGDRRGRSRLGRVLGELVA